MTLERMRRDLPYPAGWMVAAGAVTVVYPGLALGAYAAYLIWVHNRTPKRTRWIVAGVLGVLGLASSAYVPIWISGSIIVGTVGQMMVGPLALMIWHYAYSQLSGEAQAGEHTDQERTATQQLEDDEEDAEASQPSAIILGYDQSGRAVELELPEALARHVTIDGDSGTGKTTTIIRMLHDAAAAGYAAVIVDAKGTGSLRDAAEAVAAKFEVTFRVVDPEESDTITYNPARGTPANITNKLVGAFSFGPNAQVFKNVSQEVIPVLVKAMRAADESVTLRRLSANLDPKAMVGLSRSGGDAGEDLADMNERGKLYESSISGMRARFSALLNGGYGSVFDVSDEEEGLNLYEALKAGITYISLPAMASSEDSELMARVIIQDAKQVAAERIRSKRSNGEPERPALLIMDEFAALDEAEQIGDLLLQARESRISCVLSSQLLPETGPLRKTMLSAGVLMAHAVGEADAQAIAKAIGTRRSMDVSVTRRGNEEDEGSVSARPADRYIVEPREIQGYGVGSAVVRVRYGDVSRVERVKVEPPKLDI